MQNYEKRTSLLGKAGTVNWKVKQKKISHATLHSNYDPESFLNGIKKTAVRIIL